MNKFENWLKVRSSNKYSNYYKIVNYSEDNRLGFFIQYAINDIYSNIVRYTIKAAISCHGNIPDYNTTIYYAEIDIDYDTMEATLVDNVVKPGYQNCGIGSRGLDYIKDFCKSQGCKCITGKKQPVPNTEEELAKLTHFYDKNGFEQFPDNKIKFNL